LANLKQSKKLQSVGEISKGGQATKHFYNSQIANLEILGHISTFANPQTSKFCQSANRKSANFILPLGNLQRKGKSMSKRFWIKGAPKDVSFTRITY
jgi:hypothetical protein